MKLLTSSAGFALLAISGAAIAQYSPPPPPPPRVDTAIQGQQQKGEDVVTQTGAGPRASSQKVLRALLDLQKAVDAKDTASIPAKIAAANVLASTKEDRYLVAQLQLKAAIAANDNAAMEAAVDAVAASGYRSPAEVAQLYLALGGTFDKAKQFDRAAAAYQKGLAIAPNNSDLLIGLGEARVSQGQNAEAVNVFQRAIAVATAAGQKPQEAVYKRALSLAYNAKLPQAIELGRQWAQAYPSPGSWRNAIAVYRNQAQPDLEGTLDLLRLMQATGALTTAGDYALFAQAAADQSNFNEAQAVIDAGIAAGIVNPSSAQFRDTVAGLKAKPKATPADLEAAAKMSPTPLNLLRIGDRYYGLGDYARAAETYRQVLTRPGADKDLANLHLGMALARAGDKAGATAALSAVSGARADIAKYWLAFVQQHG